MLKFFEWLKVGDRRQHFFGGLLVGLISFGLWTCILATSCAAGTLELKEHFYGEGGDWIDYCLSVGGGLLGYCLMTLILLLL